MRRLALLIVVAFCLFFTTYAQVKAEVHVFNFLPGEIPLALHCQSKDDDIGYHTLTYGQELSWKFNPNYIIENTLFFCHFWWNSRDRSFTVYDEHRLDPFCLFCTTYAALTKAEVHVLNFVPGQSPLKVRCQSKDDDIGYHILNNGEEFHWSFSPNFPIENTLFFCHFWWNSKDKALKVYDERRLDNMCTYRMFDPATCYW
ncbi:hypothetical protein RJ640_009958 [Escallonia rubra]|uniref:S-protein homolog n=1 Tax=Escallonia rubra TaxID=112253 RepID=A0AA88QW97_9ASTE|nr:hypothetical protein RJ640_009958 [Escallonia rubra]